MNGQGFINKLLEDMAADKSLIIEIPMPELAKILFNGKPVKELELMQRLMNFREKYSLDYIVTLPSAGRPPMARFWKIKETVELPEESDEHDND